MVQITNKSWMIMATILRYAIDKCFECSCFNIFVFIFNNLYCWGTTVKQSAKI